MYTFDSVIDPCLYKINYICVLCYCFDNFIDSPVNPVYINDYYASQRKVIKLYISV